MTEQPTGDEAGHWPPLARRRFRVHRGGDGSPAAPGRGTGSTGIAVVPVIGEIDSVTGGPLEAKIGRELANRPPVLVLDLSLVGYVGSTALSILCRARDACRRQGTELALRGTAHDDVVRQLRIAGLERLVI
jgi:anti-sigma B factor antagonist